MRCFIIDLSSDRLQVAPEKLTPVKTVGPLTDVDVIKLRPCERKQVHLNNMECHTLQMRTIISQLGV